jgi:hypothetical protein
VATGGLSQPALIFGPAMGDGGSGPYGELGGWIEVTGLTPNAIVNAAMIIFPCSGGTNCPTDLSFTFAAFDAGPGNTLSSTGTGCAQISLPADTNGNLFIHVGKSGDAGAENNIGLQLTAPPSDAGPSDAPTGG